MAHLENAPLLEVIMELTWPSNTQPELEKFQIMAGALCSKLDKHYGPPQFLLPDANMPIMLALGKPVYRCNHKEKSHALFQIGPGLLSVNFVGRNYIWDEFFVEVMNVVETFMSVYKFDNNRQLGLNLKYVDFFPYNFAAQGNILQFLSDNFHLDIQAEFLNDLKELGLRAGQVVPAGIFRLLLNTAQLTKSKDVGFIIESQINNLVPVNDSEVFKTTISNAHEYLSNFFKKMTAGVLYESFK